jgi:hypothetical protein
MFGTKKSIDTTINTRVDHLAEMRKAIDAAISAAEDAGVKPAAMVEYFEGCINYVRRRALYRADQANLPKDLAQHAAIALTQQRRQEAERLQSEREWQDSVNQRAEADRIRSEYR